MTDTFTMSRNCAKCGNNTGTATLGNGQEVVRCAACNAYVYNRSKSESGRATRNVCTRPTIKPKRRYRILEAWRHRCAYCGADATERVLHVDHVIPLNRADEVPEIGRDFLDSDHNLVPACEECNLGKGDELTSPAVWLMLAHQRQHLEDSDPR